MNQVMSHPEIRTAIDRLRVCLARVDKLKDLRPDQLLWKPAPHRWSIAQCLDHLIVSNECYFPVLDRLCSDRYQATFWERWSPFSKSIGRNMVATLGPEVRRPFKAPKIFQPRQKEVKDLAIVDRFRKHQETLIGKLEAIRVQTINKVVVTSPVAGLITIPFPDVLEILAGHEERHLSQAERLLVETGFPV